MSQRSRLSPSPNRSTNLNISQTQGSLVTKQKSTSKGTNFSKMHVLPKHMIVHQKSTLLPGEMASVPKSPGFNQTSRKPQASQVVVSAKRMTAQTSDLDRDFLRLHADSSPPQIKVAQSAKSSRMQDSKLSAPTL
jgi:hypothetical protein